VKSLLESVFYPSVSIQHLLQWMTKYNIYLFTSIWYWTKYTLNLWIKGVKITPISSYLEWMAGIKRNHNFNTIKLIEWRCCFLDYKLNCINPPNKVNLPCSIAMTVFIAIKPVFTFYGIKQIEKWLDLYWKRQDIQFNWTDPHCSASFILLKAGWKKAIYDGFSLLKCHWNENKL
jgi:hypothetical protein